MKLQTTLSLTKVEEPITYELPLLLLGSCFVEHMGHVLKTHQFRLLQNPFGILFHPFAIEKLLERSLSESFYKAAELISHNDRWHCYDAHSSLSNSSEEVVIKTLNNQLVETKTSLKHASHIIITLGTSWVYHLNSSGAAVANCHKLPSTLFTKKLMSLEAIIASLENIIQLIQAVNTHAQLVFTVSPVRHLKDGFVENQQSKAHLIAALGALKPRERLHYFPAYEIMLDELRDYRFYNADMVHPNDLAIEYIWEKFKHAWIAEDVYEVMDQVIAIQKGLAHRPFDSESEQHKNFRKSLKKKIAELQKSYPYMDF
jgi:lysophospholipase L1-like esterase